MFEQLNVILTGTRPLLMHADTLSNPLHPITKEHKKLTSIRKKTDDDHLELAKSEWRAGLYYDLEKERPYIPGLNIEASLIEGGKLSRLGSQLKRSTQVFTERCYLEYDGPRDLQGLWDKGFYDIRSVKVQTSRIMRCRPLFMDWACPCSIVFDTEAINRDQVTKSLHDAGIYCGLGDFRPKFGNFIIEIKTGHDLT